MPEAKVPCESCPWTAKGKRPMAASVSEVDKARAAESGWFACAEDGGTCYGAVRFTQSADAELIREAAARRQGPDTPDHRPTITTPTTAVDFLSTPPSELDD